VRKQLADIMPDIMKPVNLEASIHSQKRGTAGFILPPFSEHFVSENARGKEMLTTSFT